MSGGLIECHSQNASLFDAGSLDDDKELWLIRIPEHLTAEDIASIKLRDPSRKSRKAIGSLKKDDDQFTLYAVPQPGADTDEGHDDHQLDIGVSGQEMAGLTCLVPSMEKDGKLVFAPKPFARQLILDEEVTIPTMTQNGNGSTPMEEE